METLFDAPPPQPSPCAPARRRRRPQSPTSLTAMAAALRREPSQRAKILDHLRRHGPSAIFEIAVAMGTEDHRISPRFSAMVKDKLIETTGERRMRPNSNCMAEVYRLYEPAAVAGEEGQRA